MSSSIVKEREIGRSPRSENNPSRTHQGSIIIQQVWESREEWLSQSFTQKGRMTADLETQKKGGQGELQETFRQPRSSSSDLETREAAEHPDGCTSGGGLCTDEEGAHQRSVGLGVIDRRHPCSWYQIDMYIVQLSPRIWKIQTHRKHNSTKI